MLEIITMQNQEMSIILLDLYANYFHNINFMVPSITLLFINMAVSLHIWKTWIHTTDLSRAALRAWYRLFRLYRLPCKCPNHGKKILFEEWESQFDQNIYFESENFLLAQLLKLHDLLKPLSKIGPYGIFL